MYKAFKTLLINLYSRGLSVPAHWSWFHLMSSSEAGGQTSDWIHVVRWKDPAQWHQCQQQHTVYQVPSTSKGNMWCVLINSQGVLHSGLLKPAKKLFLILSSNYSVLIWSVVSRLWVFVLRDKNTNISPLYPHWKSV